MIIHTLYTHITCTPHMQLVHTHTHTQTGIERHDRHVAASIQFQRGDAITFKVGDKEMEGEIANLCASSAGCHLVRYCEICKNIYTCHSPPHPPYALLQVYMPKSGET